MFHIYVHMNEVAYFYETCRTALFQASASLPDFVEVAGELYNCTQ